MNVKNIKTMVLRRAPYSCETTTSKRPSHDISRLDIGTHDWTYNAVNQLRSHVPRHENMINLNATLLNYQDDLCNDLIWRILHWTQTTRNCWTSFARSRFLDIKRQLPLFTNARELYRSAFIAISAYLETTYRATSSHCRKRNKEEPLLASIGTDTAKRGPHKFAHT